MVKSAKNKTLKNENRIHNWLCYLLLINLGNASLAFAQTTAKAERDTKSATNQPFHWRLVWNHDPATSATLCWNTNQPGKSHRIHLRPEDSADNEKPLIIEAQRNGCYSANNSKLYFHHAQLADLKPATKYYVVMDSDGSHSEEVHFVTAPADDVPVSLLFGADSRSGVKSRQRMNRMLAKMLEESQAAGKTPILALAHGGDFIYDGRRLDQWSQWMSDYELTTTASGRLLPIIPARGNHDGGKIFNEVFAFPSEHKNYYEIDLGPQVRLLTLNTETSVAGDQLQWLKKGLATARPEKRWLIAQYHRPAFPAVKKPWLNLMHWVPVFEKHNVDLVCEGDGHNIKRTVPIRDFQVDPTGVVYVGEGGLGVGQRTPKGNRWYLNSPQAKTGMGHHVQLLTFQRDLLTCRVVKLNGEVFDEYSRPVRKTAVATKTVENQGRKTAAASKK